MTDTDLTHELVSRLFDVDDGVLVVDGARVDRLLEAFGSPLFVYSRSVLDQAWQQLRDTYSDRFELWYSIKANPNPQLLKLFMERGTGLEVASAGEIQLALAAGCPGQNIIFAGPGKTDAELDLAVSEGLGEIHVESIGEIRRLAAISSQHGQTTNIAIRVNPTAAAGGAMRMGGQPTQFGVDEEQLDDTVSAVDGSSGLALSGLHFYLGSQILDADVLLEQYRHCLSIARRVAERRKKPLGSVDFGGGLGIPYFARDSMLDMKSLGAGLDDLMADIDGDALFQDTRFIVEPGRYLVGEAGVYLTRVVDVKSSRGSTFAITDGGMNHHLAASGNLGQVLRRDFPVLIANRIGQPAAGTTNVVGPLCTPLDLLASKLEAPAVESGDVVAILQSGAYARSASPLGFLSHASPAEVLVADSEAQLIRRRGTVDDLLQDVPDPDE